MVLTFPLQGLRPLLIAEMEKALGKDPNRIHGVDPVVTIGDLGMSGLGIKAKRVSIQLASTDPEPGATVELDSIWLSGSLWSLVSKNKTVQVKAALYDGDIRADVTFDEKQQPMAIDANIDGVDLSKIAPIIAKLGLPLEGIVDGDVELELGVAAEKDAHGRINLDVKGFGLGVGKLAIPGIPGEFTLDNGMRLGDLVLRVPIDKGAGPVELKLAGTTELEAEVTGTLNVKQKMVASRLDADGWIRPTAALLTKDPRIKSAVELADQFGGNKAKDDQGRYHFSARGPLQSLRPTMARDAGRKAAAKSIKGKGAATTTKDDSAVAGTDE